MENKRPTLLTVLCILTFIGSGLNALAYLILAIASETMGETIKMIPGLAPLLGAGATVFAVLFVASASKVFGAIKMWNLSKRGLYIYISSELIASGASFWIVKDIPEEFGGGVPTTSLIMTAVFIVLYAINIKHLKVTVQPKTFR